MLIDCPECQRRISDKATACPHCGAPASAAPRRQAPESKVCPKCNAVSVGTAKCFACGWPLDATDRIERLKSVSSAPPRIPTPVVVVGADGKVLSGPGVPAPTESGAATKPAVAGADFCGQRTSASSTPDLQPEKPHAPQPVDFTAGKELEAGKVSPPDWPVGRKGMDDPKATTKDYLALVVALLVCALIGWGLWKGGVYIYYSINRSASIVNAVNERLESRPVTAPGGWVRAKDVSWISKSREPWRGILKLTDGSSMSLTYYPSTGAYFLEE